MRVQSDLKNVSPSAHPSTETKMLLVAVVAICFCHGMLAAPSPQMTGEIRSYHQVGDRIHGEYSRLHPDGSVTKTWAFGDTKNGLQYKSYQMDPLGNVKSIANPQSQGQINQQTPQNQIGAQGQAPSVNQNPVANPNIPPGVNWFLQQPLAALDPTGADPPTPAAVHSPNVQDPLLNPFISNPFVPPQAANPLLGDPLWNLWNF